MSTIKIISYITSLILLFIIPYNVSSNLDDILGSEPNISEFNGYLHRTGLMLKIHQIVYSEGHPITILAPTNMAMFSLRSFNLSKSDFKRVLSLHVFPEVYYNDVQLHHVRNKTSITTLLDYIFDTDITHVEIIKYNGGEIGFVSTLPGDIPVKYVREIGTIISYKISVLQVSSFITAPLLLTNITTLTPPPPPSPSPPPPPAPTPPTPTPSPSPTPPTPTPSPPTPPYPIPPPLPPKPTPAPTPSPAPAPTPTTVPAPQNGVNGGGSRKDGCVKGNVSFFMLVLMCVISLVF